MEVGIPTEAFTSGVAGIQPAHQHRSMSSTEIDDQTARWLHCARCDCLTVHHLVEIPPFTDHTGAADPGRSDWHCGQCRSMRLDDDTLASASASDW